MTAILPDHHRRLLTDSEQRLHAAREHDAGTWQEILAAERVNETLPRVWACSDFIATACLRTPELLRELVHSGALFERATDDWFARDVRERVSGPGEAEAMEALRRFRKRHMVRIAWRDIAGWADLDETLRDLSALADACIGFACTYMYEALVARYGVPRGADSRQPQRIRRRSSTNT
jgi:glutamate-ammonia-ligase adenylyltransferase